MQYTCTCTCTCIYTYTLHTSTHGHPPCILPPECSEKEELDEDEEGDDLAQEFLPSPPSSPPSPAGLSLLALSVSVDSALLSMVLSVEEVSEL